MINTHVSSLNHTLEETKGWLDELQGDGPFVNEQQAYSHLRAVLHAIRDRLTVEEAVHLAAQLPMLVRGFYFEGWRPALAPNQEATREEFLGAVRASLRDQFTDEDDLDHSTRAVLRLLTSRISEGQIRHVRGQLPQGIQAMWPA
jgi:uncharacterized protein (DUF2267 family)